MKIHTVASLPHYHNHCAAVFSALPEKWRGEQRLAKRVNGAGFDPDDIVLVGGYWDIDSVKDNRIVYVEHGAGQSYLLDPDSEGAKAFHGSEHAERVVGYIAPNQRVADSWKPAAVAVGCPIVDPFAQWTPRENPKPIAVIAFHWSPTDPVCPEAGTAGEHYWRSLPIIGRELRRQGFEVWMTGHPRDSHAKARANHARIDWQPSVFQVYERADVLFADNTSLMYEMAHLGRQVVALNAPWFRRDVDHGLRFWDHVPGVQVDSVDELLQRNWHGYWARDEGGDLRDAASLYAYGAERSDGMAGVRAAEWLIDLATDLGSVA
jgi:hypothetical protein